MLREEKTFGFAIFFARNNEILLFYQLILSSLITKMLSSNRISCPLPFFS